MSLGSGFSLLNANTNTFSDWLNKTNEIITLLRNDVVTANASGASTDGNAIINGTIVANTFVVATILRGGTFGSNSTIVIGTDAQFNDDVVCNTDLTVNGDLIYVLTPNNYVNLIPPTDGNLLGNTTFRWNAAFTELDVSNTIAVENIDANNLNVTGNTNIGGGLTISGTTEFVDLVVTGTASIANLEVSSLVTGQAALIGLDGSANTSAPTVIDQFTAASSKGFKYIVHGENADANSAYAIEIMCSHNGTDVFYTRFAEVSNLFPCTLTPTINGANVELIAMCPDANSTNVHIFNIVRIETR